MALTRPVTLVSTLVLGTAAFVATAASCAAPSSTAPGAHGPGAAAHLDGAELRTQHGGGDPSGARRASCAVGRRDSGPRLLKIAMAGEPSGPAAGASRLVATTCDKASAEEIEARVKAMRAEIESVVQGMARRYA